MTNVGELDQIRSFLRDHPDLHRQAVLYNSTGIRGCVAAWADALNRGCRAGVRIFTAYSEWTAIFDRARHVLGLTVEEAGDVFAARSGRRGNETTLRLIDALIARDKGDMTAVERRTLRRYGLPEEPAT